MITLQELPIGSVVRETIENYEATVISVQAHVNGCRRALLQERRLKDGMPVQRETCDIQQLEMVTPLPGGPIADTGEEVLGLKAKDRATGYEGTIIIVETDTDGTLSFAVQSAARTATGDRVEAIWVSEPMLELLEPRRVQETPVVHKPTGPSEEPARASSPM